MVSPVQFERAGVLGWEARLRCFPSSRSYYRSDIALLQDVESMFRWWFDTSERSRNTLIQSQNTNMSS